MILELVKVLVLTGVANGTPILARNALGKRLSQPLDCGLNFRDGRPLLGPSKTLFGTLFSVIVTTTVAPILGYSWVVGALVGGFAMLGDATSSFVKRRLNMPASSKALVLDQVPECLFPLLAVRAELGLSLWQIAVLVTAFTLIELLISPLLFKWNIRNRPY